MHPLREARESYRFFISFSQTLIFHVFPHLFPILKHGYFLFVLIGSIKKEKITQKVSVQALSLSLCTLDSKYPLMIMIISWVILGDTILCIEIQCLICRHENCSWQNLTIDFSTAPTPARHRPNCHISTYPVCSRYG